MQHWSRFGPKVQCSSVQRRESASNGRAAKNMAIGPFPAYHCLNCGGYLRTHKPAEQLTVSLTLFVLAACAPASIPQAPQPIGPISPGDQLRVTHNNQCCTTPSIGIEQSLSRDLLVLQPAKGPHPQGY